MVNLDPLARLLVPRLRIGAVFLGTILVAFTLFAVVTDPKGVSLPAANKASRAAGKSSSAPASSSGAASAELPLSWSFKLDGSKGYPSVTLERAQTTALKVTLLASTAARTTITPKLALRVNAAEVGAYPVGDDLSVLSVLVPEKAWRVGKNQLDLHADFAPDEVVFDELWVEPIPGVQDQGDSAGVSLPDRLLLDVGDPDTRPLLIEGFSGDEGVPGVNGAWSDAASSQIALPLEPRRGEYRLSIHARAFSPVAPLSVEGFVNEASLGKIEVSSAMGTGELVVPAGTLKRGINRLKLVYEKTLAPQAADPTSHDTRPLALRFDWIRIEPAAP